MFFEITLSEFLFFPSFIRSGAVEQLRVHVRNLSMLGVNNGSRDNTKNQVELFERGYGKDAAGIAREAVNYG